MIPSSLSHARLLSAALLGAAIGCQDHGRVTAPADATMRPPAASHAPGSDPGDGKLDPAFGTGGLVTTDFAGGDDVILDMIVQPDGRLVAGGTASNALTSLDFALARYNVDGSLDQTFGTGGKVTTDFEGGAPGADDADAITALVLQPDGKIIAGGWTGFPQDFALARYNADGSLDASFGAAGTVRLAAEDFGSIHALVLQPDGRIVAAGVILDGNLDFWLARFNADGTLDATFGAAGQVTTDLGDGELISAIVIQPDGRLVVAGFSGQHLALARYHPNGSLDAGFGSAGVALTPVPGGGHAQDLVLLPDGGLVVLGGTEGVDPDFVLARYNSGGTLDGGFGTGGLVITDFAGDIDVGRALVLMPDGRLAAAGLASVAGKSNFALARYMSDGSLDPSFGIGGRVVVDFLDNAAAANALVRDAAGRLLAGGNSNSSATGSNFALARFADDTDGDGIPDSSDPDIVGDFAATLPDGAFAANGHRSALQSRLDAIERQIASGDMEAALIHLTNLRQHFDGCNGSATEVADGDDWVVDCVAQRAIRRLIDLLIASLGG